MNDNIPDSAKFNPGVPWDEPDSEPMLEPCDYCDKTAQYSRIQTFQDRNYREKVCYFCLVETWQEEMSGILSLNQFINRFKKL